MTPNSDLAPIHFCDLCGAPAISVAPGHEPVTLDLLGTEIIIKRGVPRRSWCEAHRPALAVLAEGKDMDWDDDAIARLRALWDEGHSTREIGRRMGTTGSAVVGKAHRLGLRSRPSPIIRSEGAQRRPYPARRAPARTLPSLAAPAEEPPQAHVPVRIPAPQRPRIAPAAPAAPALRSMPCSWPIGEPRTPGFRFCDAAGVPGKSYCPEHCAIAYVRISDRTAA